LSTNPRLVKEALCLREADYDVKVIHGRFNAWGTENDAPIARKIGDAKSVPFGPIEASRTTYLRQTVVRHGARTLTRAGWTNSSLVEASHHPVVRDLTAAVVAVPADLYVAHYVAALPAAVRAARHHRALFAFDAEDFHLGDLPEASEHELEKDLIRMIEGRYLPKASYVTAASPLIAQAYAETYGIGLPSTILNVFPKRNASDGPMPCGTAQPGPSIYWFSQTIGPGRGLETAVEAISRAASKPHLYLRGTPVSGYPERLQDLARHAGVADRLHFLEPAAPDDLERLGAQFDLGYVGELPETLNRKFALTNKLFSYLLGGVPILASDIPAHRGIANDFGPALSLFAVNDVQSLAAAMDATLLNPERLAAARAHAWRLGQERFNWDQEKTKLFDLVNQTLIRRVSAQ
jgi:glycosyltransferase involved in cell wall biosynthesis